MRRVLQTVLASIVAASLLTTATFLRWHWHADSLSVPLPKSAATTSHRRSVRAVAAAVVRTAAVAANATADSTQLRTAMQTHAAQLKLALRVAPPPRPPAIAVGAAHSRCAHRRPYHVLMTSASIRDRAPTYLEWQARLDAIGLSDHAPPSYACLICTHPRQARIAYYHYRKQKLAEPCSDLGGFTRLLATLNGEGDGLMDEIPTVAVKSLGAGTCDECHHGFVVMNRPWALLQYIRTTAYREIEENFIFVMETVIVHLGENSSISANSASQSRRILIQISANFALISANSPSQSRRILPLNLGEF